MYADDFSECDLAYWLRLRKEADCCRRKRDKAGGSEYLYWRDRVNSVIDEMNRIYYAYGFGMEGYEG